ncbi:hypothetical protein B484DRAFT_285083 [Ochromonadaceae sp. CCMP2298]|nr:hypothetical protein B484DRAFT_285083 [Ochromonadaceae sp. CCMP2298]
MEQVYTDLFDPPQGTTSPYDGCWTLLLDSAKERLDVTMDTIKAQIVEDLQFEKREDISTLTEVNPDDQIREAVATFVAGFDPDQISIICAEINNIRDSLKLLVQNPLQAQPNPTPKGVGQPPGIPFFQHPIEDDPKQAGLKMIIEYPLNCDKVVGRKIVSGKKLDTLKAMDPAIDPTKPASWYCPGHYNCFIRGGHKCKCKRIHYRHFASGGPMVKCVQCWDKRARMEKANGAKPDGWPDNNSLSELGAIWPAWPA